MGERSLIWFFVGDALNRAAYTGIDVDDEGLVIVTEEDGATVGSWHDPFNADFADFVFHLEKCGSAGCSVDNDGDPKVLMAKTASV